MPDMKKYIIGLLGLFLFTTLPVVELGAQTIVLRGKVTDKEGKPIQGASVSELDADDRIINGAQTDVAGNFAIKNANLAKNRISVTIIGYKTSTQKINGRTAINIKLEDMQGDLGEVVITARPMTNNGMINIQEKNLTTAVAKIDAKQLEEMQKKNAVERAKWESL